MGRSPGGPRPLWAGNFRERAGVKEVNPDGEAHPAGMQHIDWKEVKKMRILRGRLIYLLAAAGLLGLTACAPLMERLSGGSQLENTQWQLESLGPKGAETPVVAGSTVTLSFEAGGQAGGSGGCNSYGGNYKVKGATLSFDEVVSTLMACADETIMQQEAQYYEALRTTGEFQVSGDRLSIEYNGGESALHFVRLTP